MHYGPGPTYTRRVERVDEANDAIGRIKGAAFREFIVWWRSAYGCEGLDRAVGGLLPELKEHLQSGQPSLGVLSSSWYPAALPHRLIDGLVDNLSEEERWERATVGARAIMDANLRGVYRAVFRLVASPDRYAKYVQRIWDMHYDSGQVVITGIDEHTHHSATLDWRAHHPFICMLNMASSLPIYEAMGCNEVSFERHGCVSQGADACVSLVRWK